MSSLRINLLPRSHAERRRGRTRVAAWIVVDGASMALIATLLVFMSSARPSHGIEGDPVTSALRDQIDRAMAQRRAVQAAIEEVRADLAFEDFIAHRADWSILLATVARSMDADVALSGLVLRPNDRLSSDSVLPVAFVFEVSGVGRSQAAVSRFVLRLEETSIFERVRLLETKLHDGEVQFRVDGTIGDVASIEREGGEG